MVVALAVGEVEQRQQFVTLGHRRFLPYAGAGWSPMSGVDGVKKTYEKPTLVKAGTLTTATGAPKEYSGPI